MTQAKTQYSGPKDYIDVATRIVEFREKFPHGSLQQVSIEFVKVADRDWVVYTAAAYRSPDDERPGIGTAWEPIPGLTPYTKNSEVMVAETSAWGRAMVAALAVDTKQGIASANEVLNRTGAPATDPVDWLGAADKLNTRAGLRALYRDANAAKAPKTILDEITKRAESLNEDA